MNDRNGLFLALGALLLAVTVAVTASQAAVARAADNPNIVYILADDLGYGDLSCLNRESKIPTPNVDRLIVTSDNGSTMTLRREFQEYDHATNQTADGVAAEVSAAGT